MSYIAHYVFRSIVVLHSFRLKLCSVKYILQYIEEQSLDKWFCYPQHDLEVHDKDIDHLLPSSCSEIEPLHTIISIYLCGYTIRHYISNRIANTEPSTMKCLMLGCQLVSFPRVLGSALCQGALSALCQGDSQCLVPGCQLVPCARVPDSAWCQGASQCLLPGCQPVLCARVSVSVVCQGASQCLLSGCQAVQ